MLSCRFLIFVVLAIHLITILYDYNIYRSGFSVLAVTLDIGILLDFCLNLADVLGRTRNALDCIREHLSTQLCNMIRNLVNSKSQRLVSGHEFNLRCQEKVEMVDCILIHTEFKTNGTKS
jgi:hypothetical protein